jgi:pilus assembly protein CpaB
MGRRTLLLIASILIAAVGTALIGLYVRGADSRAQESEGAVSALVATRTIPVGATVEQALRAMKSAPVPGRMAVDGFRGSAARENLRSTLKDTVVKQAINPEQVVLESMFGAAGDVTSSGISKDFGVAVELTDPARAAGLLTPGSRVKIYLIPTEAEPEIKQRVTRPGGQLTLDPELRMPVILENALVMRIGNSSLTPAVRSTRSTNQSDNVPRTIVTLDLTQAEADAVVSAQSFGDLYFAVHGSPS